MSATLTKSLLILANSHKKFPSRCVAGLEITQVEGGYAFGPWIRPIDKSQDEGAIPFARTLLGENPVAPLQCVNINFEGPANDSNHPEDWLLTPDGVWTHIGTYGHEVFRNIPDQSGDLWGHASARSRKVIPGTANCTLRLIKPTKPVLVRAQWEYHNLNKRDQFKKSVFIEHAENVHEFSLTDPFFEDRYKISPQNVRKDKPFELTLNHEGLVIIGSLTPPYNGYQYKIAAAIIEP